MPERPTLDGIEETWAGVWEAQGTYAFDRTAARADVFSIDTPPPTVSGSLHMGSTFGYVQTDSIARYQRMRGKVLFYPMGWDDNGLPTERRVQNYYGVRCDPGLPYDPSYEPPADPPKDPVSISRRSFVELCLRLTTEDEKAFEALVAPGRPERRLGADLHDDRPGQPARQPARVPAQPRPRRGLRAGGAHPVGRRLPHGRGAGRARGPRDARRLPPGRLHQARRRAGLHRDDPPRAAAGLRGAGRAPGRRALPAAVRHDRDHAAVRGRGARARPRAGRPREGLGHRDDLHVR